MEIKFLSNDFHHVACLFCFALQLSIVIEEHCHLVKC